MMISLLASGLLAASVGSVAPAKIACDIKHLTSCRDTNVLIWSPSVTRAMIRFLGRYANNRVSYLYANGRLIAQVRDVLGGPPDDRRELPDGGHLFTACRPHSCTEKGAVAFDAQARITAVGVVNFHCGRLPKHCSEGAMLDLFVRDDGEPTKVSRTAIIEWATAAATADAAAVNHQPFRGVVVHPLKRGKDRIRSTRGPVRGYSKTYAKARSLYYLGW